jgi:hypothetical protein
MPDLVSEFGATNSVPGLSFGQERLAFDNYQYAPKKTHQRASIATTQLCLIATEIYSAHEPTFATRIGQLALSHHCPR